MSRSIAAAKHGAIAALAIQLLITAPCRAQRTAEALPQRAGAGAGLSASVTDPTSSGDTAEMWLGRIRCSYDLESGVRPIFAEENCLEINETNLYGQYVYGGLTSAKTTFKPLQLGGTYYGSGQRFGLTTNVIGYGIGDLFNETHHLEYAGGPIAGDEGQAGIADWDVNQQGHLTLTRVSAPPLRSRCLTTATQDIIASSQVQMVAVNGTKGCNPGDWIVVGQEPPTNTPNMEALKIIGVGADKISGVFRDNHAKGVVLSPALVLQVASAAGFGQGRILINRSGRTYRAGRISSIYGDTFAGSGTSWAPDLVGGGIPNIGCITLSADDYTGYPFNGSGAQGPLSSFYQIQRMASAGSLAIYRTDTAGNGNYNGRGPGRGDYTIYPCAEVLQVLAVGRNATIVLETSSATWRERDNVELAITPFPDVSVFRNITVAAYTPGGAFRRAIQINNLGARRFNNAIEINGNVQTGGNADGSAWGNGVAVAGAATGMTVYAPGSMGVYVTGPGASAFVTDMKSRTGIAFYATGAAGYTGLQSTGGAYGAVLRGSRASLVLPGTASGQIDIKIPAAAGDTVLTLPTTTGTVITSGDTGTVTNKMLTTPPLSGKSQSIGGGPLAAGQCATGAARIDHANNSMVVVVTPQLYPGDGSWWGGYVSSDGVITVKICALTAMTPKNTAYNIRVLQ